MIKYFTKEGLEQLKKELDYLQKVKRKEASERIREAVSQGDLSENASYDIAREEQIFVESKIKELKEIISQAKIIEKKENDKVQVGSFVRLKSDEEEKVFQIVDPEETDVLKDKISFESPLGKAVLDKKRGEIAEIETPGGRGSYQIVDFY